MAGQQTVDADERLRAKVYNTSDVKEQMTPADATGDQYPDPQEPEPEMAAATLGLIIGAIFLTMIVVMVFAFMYFNNANGVDAAFISWLAS
ncbi:MAG: hypothetical protein H7Z42_04425 [Roseiflexaceae bacterium]|nr:hypothetical protein [Roseiflexaceae bacterium]